MQSSSHQEADDEAKCMHLATAAFAFATPTHNIRYSPLIVHLIMHEKAETMDGPTKLETSETPRADSSSSTRKLIGVCTSGRPAQSVTRCPRTPLGRAICFALHRWRPAAQRCMRELVPLTFRETFLVRSFMHASMFGLCVIKQAC